MILRTLVSIVLPLGCNALLTIPLGALEQRGWDITWPVLLTFAASSTWGFLTLPKPLSKKVAISVAIVYYPLMIATSFYIGFVIIGRVYGSYL
jgi:hypothetical protein